MKNKAHSLAIYYHNRAKKYFGYLCSYKHSLDNKRLSELNCEQRIIVKEERKKASAKLKSTADHIRHLKEYIKSVNSNPQCYGKDYGTVINIGGRISIEEV